MELVHALMIHHYSYNYVARISFIRGQILNEDLPSINMTMIKRTKWDKNIFAIIVLPPYSNRER